METKDVGTQSEFSSNGHHPLQTSNLDEAIALGVKPLLAEKFCSYIDTTVGAIGRVVASEEEPAGAHQYCFWAAENETNLDVGHIVVTFSEEAAIIGVVDEPRRFSDLRSFLDDYFDRQVQAAITQEAATLRPELLVFTVNVLATKHLRNDVSSQRPPISGPVFYATPTAIEDALGRADFAGMPIPALMHVNGNPDYDRNGHPRRNEDGTIVFQSAPIYVDEHYLVGPEAGHANWTGQSGLATKTSHALFLTTSVFQTLKRNKTSVAALMFNVKGPDLLWLDKPALPDLDDEQMVEAYRQAGVRGLSLKERDAYERAYQALGLEPKPFENLRIFAPFKPGQVPKPNYGSNGLTGINLDGHVSYTALNTLRNSKAEAAGKLFPILWTLQQVLATPHKVFEYSDLDDKLWGFIYDIRERGIQTMDQLNALFDQAEREMEETGANEWQGHHKFTLRKARNRFKSIPSKFGGLLADGDVSYGNLPKVDDPFADQEVRVVDIAHCNTNVQDMLVSTIITKVWQMAENESLGVEKLIIFVDELNKYAPAGAQSGLRDTLVDIAARGRHLNVVLFGAQQFRSKVETEILGNCGTSFYGRVGDEEIVNSAYRSLTDTAKAELLGLPKGRLLVRHAHFRAPLFGTFPLPPTIPGMAGQRIFNEGAGASHPADGLWNLLKGVMGEDKVPPKAKIRDMAANLSPQQCDKAITQFDLVLRTKARQPGFRPMQQLESVIGRIERDGVPF